MRRDEVGRVRMGRAARRSPSSEQYCGMGDFTPSGAASRRAAGEGAMLRGMRAPHSFRERKAANRPETQMTNGGGNDALASTVVWAGVSTSVMKERSSGVQEGSGC